MEKVWFCHFKETEDSITVGSVLSLYCDGEALKTPLKTKTLSLHTQQPYSLVLLKTLKTEKDFLALKVTSYRTGAFKTPFYITDGEQFIKVENLSFKVQSLLTKKDTKAHPAFGPFLTKSPYFMFSVFSFGCFLLILLIFLYRFFKRTRFVKKTLKKRVPHSPSKSFTLRLRQEEGQLIDAIINLEKNFKTFLEEQLLIPVKKQKIEKIMTNLKTYHPNLYKKSGTTIKQLLKEFTKKDPTYWNHKIYLKLKKICQDLVFTIEMKQ